MTNPGPHRIPRSPAELARRDQAAEPLDLELQARREPEMSPEMWRMLRELGSTREMPQGVA